MKTSELLKILKQYGIYKIREGGNHTQYKSPITGKTFSLSRHAKEIPTGTANKILKDAGIK